MQLMYTELSYKEVAVKLGLFRELEAQKRLEKGYWYYKTPSSSTEKKEGK